jgi:hypothetical protein
VEEKYLVDIAIGLIWMAFGVYTLRRQPVVLSSHYAMPFLVVIILLVAYRPFMSHVLPAEDVCDPLRLTVIVFVALVIFFWSRLFGRILAFNIDKYDAYDAVRSTLQDRGINFRFDTMSELSMKGGKFNIPSMESSIIVDYRPRMSWAIVRFYEYGINKFDNTLLDRTEEALRGYSFKNRPVFGILNVAIGAIVIIIALASGLTA